MCRYFRKGAIRTQQFFFLQYTTIYALLSFTVHQLLYMEKNCCVQITDPFCFANMDVAISPLKVDSVGLSKMIELAGNALQ